MHQFKFYNFHTCEEGSQLKHGKKIAITNSILHPSYISNKQRTLPRDPLKMDDDFIHPSIIADKMLNQTLPITILIKGKKLFIYLFFFSLQLLVTFLQIKNTVKLIEQK